MTNRTDLLAGLLLLGLAGCASTSTERLTSISGSGDSFRTDFTAPNRSSAQPSASVDRLTEPSLSLTQSSAIELSGVVQSIDMVHREDTGVESGSVGTAAGSSDVLYRVIMQMDDGTMQTFEQDTQPTYQNGDRIQVLGGVVGKY